MQIDGTNSRTEELLVTGVEETKKPLSRIEAILRGEDIKPQSRIEKALQEGGGGSKNSILSGDTEPSSTLGKDGDLYLQYETRNEEEALIENQQIPDTNDYITDILAEDYETLKFYVYQYNQGTETEYDHYIVNVAISYLMDYGHVKILDADDHVVANITITNDGYIKMINNSSLLEYYLVFSIYEPVVKPNSITDIYLKVDDEWVKDGFGRATEVTAVLEAGQTSVTLQSDAITTDSTFDIYTNVFGVDPTDVTVANGRITLTFDAQDTDVNVKVRVS